MARRLIAVLCAACAAAPAGAVAATADGTAAAFPFSSRPIPGTVRERVVASSWRAGCPVPLRRLRYLTVGYFDFAGKTRRGELIVHADAVPAVRAAFARLYARGFPIRRMRLVDDYGASDTRSIEADNTSAFNCRAVTGGSGWSQHAYGRAIDVNPIENPYVYPDGTTSHPASVPYLDRSRHRPGMAFAGGTLVRAFKRQGWGWGGDWTAPRDLQHFSATGR